MNIVEELKGYSESSRLSMIIRHGDREQIPSGEYGNEILLNSKGIENSIALGEALKKYNISKILTSPIQRCVQTAEFVAKGYGMKLEIIETDCLGAPGLHITDEKIAGEYYLEHGFFKILDEFTNGITSPGMRNSLEFNKLMNDFVCNNSNKEGITIFITHDAVISLYHYCYNQKKYTPENWIEYLDGFIIPVKNE